MISVKLKQLQTPQQSQALQSTTERNIKQSSAWKRVLNDYKDLKTDMPQQIKITWPDPEDIMNLDVIISPDENFWKGAHFPFSVRVPEDYPINPPKVLSKKVIYHPNIDTEGKVCLNILREDWKPVSQLKDVMFGLLYLFLTPNPTDPLNKEAAEIMLKDKDQFAQQVMRANKGETVNGQKYDRTV